MPEDIRPAWQDYLRRSDALEASLPTRIADPQLPETGPAEKRRAASYAQGIPRDPESSWFLSDEAACIADHVSRWQKPDGGWSKEGDYRRDPNANDLKNDVWSAGTFDNDATVKELRFLGRMILARPDLPAALVWKQSFARGLDYVFAAQFPNGGFPQVYPLAGSYHDAITLNDSAMVRAVTLLRDIGGQGILCKIVSAETAVEADRRFRLGIACLLATQFHDSRGNLCGWAQQHDALDLRPVAARNFEPAALSTAESCEVMELLMSLDPFNPAVVNSVHAAARWLEDVSIKDTAYVRLANGERGLKTLQGAPLLWPRLIEPNTGKPIFGDRDRMIHFQFEELSLERQRGYAWFLTSPGRTVERYESWARSHSAPPKR